MSNTKYDSVPQQQGGEDKTKVGAPKLVLGDAPAKVRPELALAALCCAHKLSPCLLQGMFGQGFDSNTTYEMKRPADQQQQQQQSQPGQGSGGSSSTAPRYTQAEAKPSPGNLQGSGGSDPSHFVAPSRPGGVSLADQIDAKCALLKPSCC